MLHNGGINVDEKDSGILYDLYRKILIIGIIIIGIIILLNLNII